MQEPEFVLENGTKIHTNDPLGSIAGLLVKQEYLDARRANTPGIIRGWVAGHGGDVYWVQHGEGDDAVVGVYGWMDFELVVRTRHERLMET